MNDRIIILANSTQDWNISWNIRIYGFIDLFNNINLSHLPKIIIQLFKQHKNQLTLPDYIDTAYFHTLTNFIIHNDYILQSNMIYVQKVGITYGGCMCTYSILSDLHLYQYENTYSIDNILIFRNIDAVILIDTTNSDNTSLPIVIKC